MFRSVALIFSSIIPRRILKKNIKAWLQYAGSRENERVWAGTRMILIILIGLIGFFLPGTLFPIINTIFGTELFFTSETHFTIQILFMFGFIFLTIAVTYLHITYAIDGRKKMVETVLPDFLMLVSSNLKSGMTPFSAFRSAVRPEFGPLSEEIKIATQRSLGLESFSKALKHLADRIDSNILKETAKFFAQALVSGGHLADLIESSAKDIRQAQMLKDELLSSTRMYTLFIIFVVVIASPMLLAVSVQFLAVMASVVGPGGLTVDAGSASDAAQIGFTGGEVSISPEFMQTMALILLVSNSILASIFIGVLGGGKVRAGFKFAPVLLIGGLGAFFVMLGIIGGLLSGFM